MVRCLEQFSLTNTQKERTVTMHDEIHERFKHHPPTPERIESHQVIRNTSEDLAHVYVDILPDSREKSLALTALQEAAMWANAALAIHGPDNESEK